MCAEQSDKHFNKAFRKLIQSIQNDALVAKVEEIQKELDHLLGFYADVHPKIAIFPEVQNCLSFLKDFKEENRLSFEVPDIAPKEQPKVYNFLDGEEYNIKAFKKDCEERDESLKKSLEKYINIVKKCVSDLKREVNDKE